MDGKDLGLQFCSCRLKRTILARHSESLRLWNALLSVTVGFLLNIHGQLVYITKSVYLARCHYPTRHHSTVLMDLKLIYVQFRDHSAFLRNNLFQTSPLSLRLSLYLKYYRNRYHLLQCNDGVVISLRNVIVLTNHAMDNVKEQFYISTKLSCI